MKGSVTAGALDERGPGDRGPTGNRPKGALMIPDRKARRPSEEGSMASGPTIQTLSIKGLH
jgi:hypothetical protein